MLKEKDQTNAVVVFNGFLNICLTVILIIWTLSCMAVRGGYGEVEKSLAGSLLYSPFFGHGLA